MMGERCITEPMLDQLREKIASTMSKKRYDHTLGVEKMAARLGALYCPSEISVLRAAALLHDITKEESFEKQLQLCEKFDIIVDEIAKKAPKTLHSMTAAALIGEQYPEFADPRVIDAVRWHTTGRANMTLLEQLIYLADYIDDTRRFVDCVLLREMFWSAKPEEMDLQMRRLHLHRVLLHSYDLTIKALLEEGSPISEDSFRARNQLLLTL